MQQFEYDTVEPALEYRVLTLIPKKGDHEFREYIVNGDEIGDIVFQMENPAHAERIVTIEEREK